MSAIIALLGGCAVIAATVVGLARRPFLLLAAIACLALAVGAASYSVTRTGPRRAAAAVLAILTIIAPLALVFAVGQFLVLVLVIVLTAMVGATTRYAFGRNIASLKSGPTPGVAVGPAARPVIIMNPKSGSGKVERFALVEEAAHRGIESIVLGPGDDLLRIAEEAVRRGADVIGMAGGDGSQALVAGVAMRHDIAYVCVPAGTRNHLAVDLGLDRDDVVGALDAFGEAVERRIDLAVIGERLFVNNATLGLYAKIVQSPEYRDRKVGTVLDMLPGMLGPRAQPFDLGFTGPDGEHHPSAHLIMVSNGPYELGGEGFGSRRRIDSGMLGIVAATFPSSKDLSKFLQLEAIGQQRRFPGWLQWVDSSFEVRSSKPIEIGIDGEATVLDPPIEFRTIAGALRVRIPRHAPGYSPAAAVPRPGWSTIAALVQTAAGRPVSIEV